MAKLGEFSRKQLRTHAPRACKVTRVRLGQVKDSTTEFWLKENKRDCIACCTSLLEHLCLLCSSKAFAGDVGSALKRKRVLIVCMYVCMYVCI